MSKINVQVHALPTQKANTCSIVLSKRDGSAILNPYTINSVFPFQESHYTFNHLYVTTSETPREGDWFMTFAVINNQRSRPDVIFQCEKRDGKDIYLVGGGKFGGCNEKNDLYFAKIVATDDKLRIGHYADMKDAYLPQISPEFQQAWVKEANKGTPIIDAMMEMYDAKECYMAKEWNTPKLNSFGYVTILPIKEKLKLPDIYSGELNTQRIKRYKALSELYDIEEGTIRDIFCKGADWYKTLVDTPIKEKMYTKEELQNHLEEFTFFFAGEHHRIEAPGYVEGYVSNYLKQNL